MGAPQIPHPPTWRPTVTEQTTPDLNIFQQALGYAELPREASLDSETPAGAVFIQNFDQIRQELLSSYRWRFAQKRARLEQANVSDPEKYPWQYAWRQPVDYVDTVNYRLYDGTNIGSQSRVGTGNRLRLIEDHNDFEIYDYYGYEKRGDIFLTETPTVDMMYTWNVPSRNWSALARRLLILKLAYVLNSSLLPIGSTKDRIEQQIQLTMQNLGKELLPTDSLNLNADRGYRSPRGIDSFWTTQRSG